jgi:hypothetical protein
LHLLSDLDGLVANYSRDRRNDMRVAQVEPGLIQRSLGRLNSSLGLTRSFWLRQQLPRVPS